MKAVGRAVDFSFRLAPVRWLLALLAAGALPTVAHAQAVAHAQDAGGPVIDVWHGLRQRVGHLGRAQNDFNLLGHVSDPDGVALLTYRLGQAPPETLSVGRGPFGDGRRLAARGDFNADIPLRRLSVGDNAVTLAATDSTGARAEKVVRVIRERGGRDPLPARIDWSRVGSLQEAGQVVDGPWGLTEKGLRTLRPGYDRLFLIGNETWQDYEVTVPVTIHRVSRQALPRHHGASGVGLVMRFGGHAAGTYRGWPEAQPKWGYQPFGAIGWLRWTNGPEKPPVKQFYRGDYDSTRAFGALPSAVEGQTFWMKMRAQTLPGRTDSTGAALGRTRYSWKLWPKGAAEPEGWSWQVVQQSRHALRRGGVALLAHHVDATFGDARVTPVPDQTGLDTVSLDTAGRDTAGASVRWTHLSSASGDLEAPNEGNQQTSAVVADVDGDGTNDFFITERTAGPSVVWYRRGQDEWTRHVVEEEPLPIEAGSAHYDVDGDGDEDLVAAGDSESRKVWWWENPAPRFDAAGAPGSPVSWTRRLIAETPGAKHHDQLFGDFDGDGQAELVFWNQGAQTLFLSEIPEDPQQAAPWPLRPIYRYSADSQMAQRGTYPNWRGTNEHEGLYAADIDGNDTLDVVGGGRWFGYAGQGRYQENIIDASYPFSRAAAGDLVEGGRPEVALVVGDGRGPLVLYAYHGGTWQDTTLIEAVQDGHSLDVADVNEDGHQDIFVAEMRLGENSGAKTWILLGDGQGSFRPAVVSEGYGLHEAKVADLDGDGDLDILGKPYTWAAPRLDLWLNEGRAGSSSSF